MDQERAHPLGPLLIRSGTLNPGRTRLIAAGVLLGGIALLGLAWWLEPDPRGFGTHEQLGLAPCSLVLLSGLPCPTCGMTTSFAHAVRGRPWRAFVSQPLGLLLALLTVVISLLAAHALVSGRSWRINWYRVSPRLVLVLALAFFGLAWLFKILQTALR